MENTFQKKEEEKSKKQKWKVDRCHWVGNIVRNRATSFSTQPPCVC